MKDKILQALKKQIVDKAGKTSINDRTLNSFVDAIADKITDESQIESAITPYVTVLKEMQGNINSVAAEAAKQKEEELKKIVPPVPPVPPVIKTAEELDAERIAKAVAEAMKPFAEKIQGFETQTKAEKRAADIQAKAKEYGIPETFVKRFSIKEEDDIDTFMKDVKQDFTNIGFSGTTPPDRAAGPEKDASAIASLIEKGTEGILKTQKK